MVRGPVAQELLEGGRAFVLCRDEWSGTITTLVGSKTRLAPIFSIARNAMGPEMSFVITTSQRTMTMSPGATASASVWSRRIFSASVSPMARGYYPARRSL